MSPKCAHYIDLVLWYIARHYGHKAQSECITHNGHTLPRVPACCFDNGGVGIDEPVFDACPNTFSGHVPFAVRDIAGNARCLDNNAVIDEWIECRGKCFGSTDQTHVRWVRCPPKRMLQQYSIRFHFVSFSRD